MHLLQNLKVDSFLSLASVWHV